MKQKVLNKCGVIHEFAVLDITSWVGVCGQHYYGKIKFKRKSYEVKKRLSKREAQMLNELEDSDSLGFSMYTAGESSGRFSDKRVLIKKAIGDCKKKFPKAIGLFEGMTGCYSPQKILFGSDGWVDGANAIWEKEERLYRQYGCCPTTEEMKEIEVIENKWITFLYNKIGAVSEE